MSASAGRYVAEGIKHGTASGYTTARCRCEECTAAHSRCQWEYREKNPEARRKAREHQAKVYASDPEAAGREAKIAEGNRAHAEVLAGVGVYSERIEMLDDLRDCE